MHLIFGGAYQGKLDYAKERYGLEDKDIFFCGAGEGECPGPPCKEFKECPAETSIDFNKKAVYHLEEFILACVRNGKDAADYLAANRGKWEDTVFICTDISSGVVPVDQELRAWREMTGRTLIYLGKEAEEVTRMFCGLPQKIK
jgi:adenosyl cobinamide kinase/adenosyl cobinamide phosphate guanylyltransferase